MPECDLNAGLGLGLAQIFSVAGTFRRHIVHQMIRYMPHNKTMGGSYILELCNMFFCLSWSDLSRSHQSPSLSISAGSLLGFSWTNRSRPLLTNSICRQKTSLQPMYKLYYSWLLKLRWMRHKWMLSNVLNSVISTSFHIEGQDVSNFCAPKT